MQRYPPQDRLPLLHPPIAIRPFFPCSVAFSMNSSASFRCSFFLLFPRRSGGSAPQGGTFDVSLPKPSVDQLCPLCSPSMLSSPSRHRRSCHSPPPSLYASALNKDPFGTWTCKPERWLTSFSSHASSVYNRCWEDSRVAPVFVEAIGSTRTAILDIRLFPSMQCLRFFPFDRLILSPTLCSRGPFHPFEIDGAVLL